jgi:AcrR family transcriptional regulator
MGEKKNIRINEIVEAAISEFIEKGYEKASMESIAKAANLSKGGLYHHFSSKADILFTVNLKILEPVHDIIYRIKENVSLVEGLNQFITEYLSYWYSHKREITLYFFTMNISFSNSKIMGYYEEFARQEFDCFEAYFLQGQESGIFKLRNARTHSLALISCLDGYLAYMLMVPELKLEDIINEMQQTFITDYLIKQ